MNQVDKNDQMRQLSRKHIQEMKDLIPDREDQIPFLLAKLGFEPLTIPQIRLINKQMQEYADMKDRHDGNIEDHQIMVSRQSKAFDQFDPVLAENMRMLMVSIFSVVDNSEALRVLATTLMETANWGESEAQ